VSHGIVVSSLPNAISIARLLAVPVMVWFIVSDRLDAAFWLFVAAGISDGVDGFIAKRFNAESQLGRYLDPIADKTMLVCIYVTLGLEDRLSSWLVILVVFRDALIVGGALLSQVLEHSLSVRPLYISKVNTVAQIVLAAVVLADVGLLVPEFPLVSVLEYAVAATTAISGALYLMRWLSGAAEAMDGVAREGRGASANDDRRDNERRQG
jgi:cardiolipin synthase (CMP-forming)